MSEAKIFSGPFEAFNLYKTAQYQQLSQGSCAVTAINVFL